MEENIVLNEKRMWNDKRYYSVDSYIKENYGMKMYKLALHGGMTCPNRDGTVGNRGCIFCSQGGSGDFAASSLLSITEQIEEAKTLIQAKVSRNIRIGDDSYELSDSSDAPEGPELTIGLIDRGPKYIAYFQAFTNTYASIDYLRKIFYEAIENPSIGILSIATRPDCLGDDVIDLLRELNKKKPVWVELGLQTIHEDTAKFIRRGYKLPVFDKAVEKLSAIGVQVIVHLILGLPGETEEMMLETVKYVSSKPITGVKLQLLHVLKGTGLVNYLATMKILTMEEYTDLVIKCMEYIPQNIVIHRITGDGPKGTLLAPMWSRDKKTVINTINHKMKELDSWQGKKYIPQ